MNRAFFRRLSFSAPAVTSASAVLSAILVGALGYSMVASAQSSNAGSAPAQAQTAAPAAKPQIPDAQVEASVLKGLAGAPDLANQSITTTTVYGVVTLSGSVATEAERVEAETIASRTHGVQKVVDELTLGGQNTSDSANLAPPETVQQAQGTPDSDNTEPAQAGAAAHGDGADANAPVLHRPYVQPPQRGYVPLPTNYNAQPVYGGQEAGINVTVPPGALLRIRINQTLTSASAKAGDSFDGIVVSDVVAEGVVAIPRGATVQGSVVDAKKAGALVGRGELSLQLTQVTLGGKVYPIASDVWGRNGGDKTTQTVNNTAVGGAIGALFGAVAGGGKGAAIGAGVGGALGLGSSAASGSGQIFVPSEGLLTFHLAQPAPIATVSQAEMDRLAQGAPLLQRRYPPPSYGPVYYRPYPNPYYYPYPY